jgi:hypothetical protein
MKFAALILSILSLAGAVFVYRHFEKRLDVAADVNSGLSLKIATAEKLIPQSVRLIKIADELYKAGRGKLTPPQCAEMARLIVLYSELYGDIGITPDKIFAIAERESGFDPKAVSKAKCYGIMQLHPGTFNQHSGDVGYGKFTKELALNPVINLHVALEHLVFLKLYWLGEGIADDLPVYTSFFWGVKITQELFASKKRANLPSLEYAKGIIVLAAKWRERGVQ